MSRSRPPAAAGVRAEWPEVPGRVRAAIEARLGGPVESATPLSGGFSPGAAARLETSDGRRVFAKAVGPEPNPDSPAAHRREAEIAAALPPDVPAPKLLWSYDEGSRVGSPWPSRTWTAAIPRSPGGPTSWTGCSTPSLSWPSS